MAHAANPITSRGACSKTATTHRPDFDVSDGLHRTGACRGVGNLKVLRPPTLGRDRVAIGMRTRRRVGSEVARYRLPAPCDVRGLGRERVQAPSRKRSIQSLSPSACLPFQARGKTLDRPPAASACLPFQARGKVADRPLAVRTCLPFQTRGKVPDRPPATALSPSRSRGGSITPALRPRLRSRAASACHPPGCRATAGCRPAGRPPRRWSGVLRRSGRPGR